MATATIETTTRTGTRDGVTAMLSGWLMLGLLVDGYMHNARGEQLESFFTPWHGLLYSGFLATAVWILWPLQAARGPVRDRVATLDPGYALGAVGAVVFAVGGFADAVWHSMFGIEVDLEALLSPPHLVLLAGAMLVVTTPARAAWLRRDDDAPGLRAFAPALASVTLATLLAAFFLMYVSGLFDFHATADFVAAFAPGGVLVEQPFLQEVLTAFGVAARLLTTVLLVVPVLLLVRRWVLPMGSLTILCTAYAVFMLVLGEFRLPEMVAAGVVAGVVGDVLIARTGPGPDRVGAVRVLATTVPAVLWGAHFVLLAVAGNLGWPFLLWGGTVLLAAGTGYGLSLLAVPPEPLRSAR